MPASQTPINPNTPTPEETSAAQSPEQNQPSYGNSDAPIMLGRSSSRYVDYDSHELLERISQYEDERRWQRIREGIWISIIAHILLFAALYLVPRYVFNQTQVIDPFDAIKQRKDLTYLDELPDALKQLQKAKPKLPPLKQSETIVDKKTLDALKAAQAARAKVTPPAPKPAETPAPAPPQVAQTPQPPQPAPLPPSTAAPTPNPQVALDAPRPSPVPAKPNFNLGSQNPADQLRQAMKNSAAAGSGSFGMRGPGLAQHSGADGGAQILSDTQGVDFGPYMQRLIRETYRTWDPLIPEEVNPPINKTGKVEIIFTILPNGRLQPHAMLLTGRSGDVALDRAAWGAIEGADYPPLPKEFHGPYLQLRFMFEYNTR